MSEGGVVFAEAEDTGLSHLAGNGGPWKVLKQGFGIRCAAGRDQGGWLVRAAGVRMGAERRVGRAVGEERRGARCKDRRKMSRRRMLLTGCERLRNVRCRGFS